MGADNTSANYPLYHLKLYHGEDNKSMLSTEIKRGVWVILL